VEKVPSGYNGKILRVNLSESSISTEAIDDMFCRKYLGGSGFVAYFLLKELPQGVDPLGPDNKLIFALGPVTGVSITGSGRNTIGAKSPLSGGIALSQVGEFWGTELKRAGYDAVIIEGRAAKPMMGKPACGMPVTSGVKILKRLRKLSGQSWAMTGYGWH
jgi:aldehyde:ferredoxin oxidoreductase